MRRRSSPVADQRTDRDTDMAVTMTMVMLMAATARHPPEKIVVRLLALMKRGLTIVTTTNRAIDRGQDDQPWP